MQVLLFPVRLILRALGVIFSPFGLLFRRARKVNAFRAVRKSVAGQAAQLGTEPLPEETAAVTLTENLEEPAQVWATVKSPNFFFKRMTRPQLVERVGAELQLEQARVYADAARRFFTHDFSLFPEVDLFYEEIEESYLSAALGADRGSIDRFFLVNVDCYRRTVNDNARTLFLVIAPVLIGIALAAPLAATANLPPLLQDPVSNVAALFGGASFIALIVLAVLYRFLFEPEQQRNTQYIDTYITSKFGRINANFQVAKRKSLNVERDKRLAEADELKEEAAVWTLSYQWFAMRLWLCEMMIRNTMFQVRRNTALYRVSGIALSLLAVAIAAASLWYFEFDLGVPELSPGAQAGAVAAVGALAILLAYGVVMSGAFRLILAILQDNQWVRFNMVGLPDTIADHVGEDKVQILTFRDRHRIEN